MSTETKIEATSIALSLFGIGLVAYTTDGGRFKRPEILAARG